MYLHPFEFRLLKQLRRDLPENSPEFLVLVSGGKDSMSLLHAMNKLVKHSNGDIFAKAKVEVMHFNHKTRGDENSREEELVVDTCLNLGVPVTVKTLEADVTQHNFHSMARQWRYSEAKKHIADWKSPWICTAHHKDDQAETVLHNLFRGTGIDGLKGIQYISEQERILRPFLNSSQKEVLKYLQESHIPFIEDSSNLSLKYKRNEIRQKLIPMIEKIFPEYLDRVFHLTQVLQESEQENLPESKTEEYIYRGKNGLHSFLKSQGANLTQKQLQNLEAQINALSSKKVPREISIGSGNVVRVHPCLGVSVKKTH